MSEIDDYAKPQGRRPIIRRSPFVRSRVGNGKALLNGIDTHSGPYREFATIVSDLVEHLGSDPSVVEYALAEEAASLIYWLRRARLYLLTDSKEFNIQLYATASNSLRRILSDIGQERRLQTVVDEGLIEYDRALRELEQEDAS
jgi:hypothetical protein